MSVNLEVNTVSTSTPKSSRFYFIHSLIPSLVLHYLQCYHISGLTLFYAMYLFRLPFSRLHSTMWLLYPVFIIICCNGLFQCFCLCNDEFLELKDHALSIFKLLTYCSGTQYEHNAHIEWANTY